MVKRQRTPRTVKATLIRFAVASIVLMGLTIGCFRTADPDLKVLAGLLAFPAFIVTLLFGVDAGKAINREPTASPRLRTLGAVLVFPGYRRRVLNCSRACFAVRQRPFN